MGKRRPTTPLPSGLPDTLHGAVVDAEVDLHGMRADEALRRVDGFLSTWDRQPAAATVRFITGKGNRSAGRPVLLNAVGDRLREELGGRIADMVLDAGGGGWLVRLKR